MSDLASLTLQLDKRAFAHRDGFLPAALIAASEDAIRALVSRLIDLGPRPREEQVRAEINACVRRFNELDATEEDPWICTIEREDITEVLWELIALCGFEGTEEWVNEREW